MAKDYYSTLGVEKSATKEEIRKAYKRLAKQYHPDLNKDAGAADKFKEINEAASILGDDQKRQQYDQYGTAEPGQGFDYRDFGGFRNFGEDFDFGDIFDMFFGGGGFSRGPRRDYSGSDLRFDMTLDLQEVANGVEKTIIIPRLEECQECSGTGAKKGSDVTTCSECKGTGRVTRTRRTPFGLFQTTTVCDRCGGEGRIIKDPCPACKGQGRMEKEAKIKINIPAGVEEGMRLRVQGEGDKGTKGYPSGDLYVVMHVRQHKLFERQGDDLYMEVPVSFTQLALGETIEVPTLEGKSRIKVPPGTQSGTVFKIKDAGLPRINRFGRGDQLVRVSVQVPQSLTRKQRDMLEAFAKESGESAQPHKGFFKGIFDKL